MSRVPVRWLVCLGLAPLLCASGCFPSAAWLPDSSGFVFPSGDKGDDCAFYHFDLQTKKSKLLFKQADAQTLVPGVSPDGKQIAVARVQRWVTKPSTMQLFIHDRDGKLVKKSAAVTFGKGDKNQAGANEPDAQQNFVHWSPDGKKVLVSAGSVEDQEWFGVFDVAKETLEVHGGCVPVWQGTPILPDSSGFVALVPKGKPKEDWAFVLTDWKGKQTEVQGGDKGEEYAAEAYWDKGTFVWRGLESVVRLDPVKRKAATEQAALPLKLKGGEEVEGLATFGDGKTRLYSIHWKEQPAGDDAEKDHHRFEVHFADGTPPRKILSREGGEVLLPTVSPDGKLAAVRLGNEIFVINAKGELVATAKLEKK